MKYLLKPFVLLFCGLIPALSGFAQSPSIFHIPSNTINFALTTEKEQPTFSAHTTTETVIAVDFCILPKKAMTHQAEQFRLVSMLNESSDLKKPALETGFRRILNKEKNTLKKQATFLSTRGSASVSEQIETASLLPNSLLLGGIPFKYDETHHAIYANGEVDLLGMQGVNINKRVRGVVEIALAKHEGASDTLHIFFETDDLNWTYFSFSGNEVSIATSEKEKVEEILRKNESGNTSRFHYRTLPEKGKDDFLLRFATRYIWKS